MRIRHLLLTLALAAALVIGPRPASIVLLEPSVQPAEARPGGRRAGFSGGRGGARHKGKARPRGARTKRRA
ncbi:MAG: hypothetical protein AAFZ09_10190 [Pseudomonadota bacterium]